MRIRIYHPEYPVRWLDRLYDLFSGRIVPPRATGVDYTLLNRVSLQDVRAFLDGVANIALLGQEMVRVDSTFRLPEDHRPAVACIEGLIYRLRVAHTLPGGARLPLDIRWAQFEPTPQGTRVLLRLTAAPHPQGRVELVGNLNTDASGDWLEYAVGRE